MTEGLVIGNLNDKKEIKRLKKLGLPDREIRNLRDQQTTNGKKRSEVDQIPATLVEQIPTGLSVPNN